MKHKKVLSIAISAMITILLIIDTQTAKNGVTEGITLCINVIIPSLFPFFVVTGYLNAAILGMKLPGMQWILNLLKLPKGSESLLLLGLIGGYPVGAQLIADAHKRKQMDLTTAQIMLGYCNNAGPAFIFGITAVLFSSPLASLVLWVIHILSALATGLLLPRSNNNNTITSTQKNLSLVTALKNGIAICAAVCGWVIVFKVIVNYLDHWLGDSQAIWAIAMRGILELSNGCLLLSEIPSESMRFLLCAAFLAFGGICVLMQTASAAESTGLGLYIPGKIIQTCVSILLAMVSIRFLYADWFPSYFTLFIITASILLILIMKHIAEKSCGNPKAFHV